MDRCPKDDPTAKNLVCKESSSHSREKLEKYLLGRGGGGGGINPPGSRRVNALSKQVIFLGDFNSKDKQFGCLKRNKSGQTPLNIAKDLKLFYVNLLSSNRHTREDSVHGTSHILDMRFLSV